LIGFRLTSFFDSSQTMKRRSRTKTTIKMIEMTTTKKPTTAIRSERALIF